MDSNTPSRPEPSGRQSKKTYRKPRVQTYGDLPKITQSQKGSKSKDGAGHANKHYTS